MPIGIFIGPMQLSTNSRGQQQRDCPILLAEPTASWREARGGYYVAVVDAPNARLTALAALPNVTRVPKAAWDDPLSSLTAPQRTALRNLLTAMGVTAQEFTTAFPADLAGATVGEVVAFITDIDELRVKGGTSENIRRRPGARRALLGLGGRGRP